MRVNDVSLRGAHNIEKTFSPRWWQAEVVGVDPAPRSVRQFKGGASYRVAAKSGVVFYNDSKATNIDSTIKAVDCSRATLILILGEKTKYSSYCLHCWLSNGRVKHVLLIDPHPGFPKHRQFVSKKTFVTTMKMQWRRVSRSVLP